MLFKATTFAPNTVKYKIRAAMKPRYIYIIQLENYLCYTKCKKINISKKRKILDIKIIGQAQALKGDRRGTVE
jgi:hypothetical protein